MDVSTGLNQSGGSRGEERMRRAISLMGILAMCALHGAGIAAAGEGRLFSVSDGSFENGICGGGSAWTCLTDTECENWIVDPMVEWELPAHQGDYVGQLGGSCGNELNSNSFCQDINIYWPCGFWLTWSWLGIVDGSNPGSFRMTVDGDVIPEHDITPMGIIEDSGGLWQDGWTYIWGYQGVCTVCLEFDAGLDESVMLIDSVSHPISPTPVSLRSFSTVKSSY